MIFELISIGLAVATAIAATFAFIYKKGITAGTEKATLKRIEQKLYTLQKDGDEVHDELKKELKEIHSKVDNLQGSFETFKELIKKN